jgi:hypothetical protein
MLTEKDKAKLAASCERGSVLSEWAERLDHVLRQVRAGQKPVDADPYLEAIDALVDLLEKTDRTGEQLNPEEDTPLIARYYRSARYGTNFVVGMEVKHRSTFLDYSLVSNPQLHRAKAELWEHAASLERIADRVEWHSHYGGIAAPDPAVERALQRPRSATFHLMASCVLRHPDVYPDHGGSLTLQWNWGRPVEEVVVGVIESFKRLTRINWCLHRVDYEDAHARR